jgi:hypothetical protein
MNHLSLQTVAAYIGLFVLTVSCSTNNGLRKFDDSNIRKEIPAEVAEKFEVKDVSALSKTPAPAKPAEKVITKKTKSKKGSAVTENKEPAIPPMRRLDQMPFVESEKLSYDIRYVGVTAATFNIEVLPVKVVNDRKVYHLKARAKTVKFFELVYRVDDSIESFWDFDGLYSHRFTMDLDESKQSRKLIELYDYEKRKSYYWNRIDHSEKGFSEQKEEHDIKLWSQDPLSLLYYLRVVQLPQNKGDVVKVPVILDGKQWEAVITFDRKEKMSIGNRVFEANVFKLENYQNGELKNKDNTVWISNDEHRYLLRIEAKVKVGSFAIALDRIL